MADRARIAVIGTGWWATWAHIPALQQNPSAELVALCDQDAAKVAQTAQTYGVPKTYTDIEALLDGESLDGVIVATNHASHYEVAAAALKAGLHVLLEKPMTLFAPEARDLVNLSNQHGGELIIGYNYNYTPYVIRSRELMLAGKLGAAQYITGIFNQEARSFLSGKPRVEAGPHHSPGNVCVQRPETLRRRAGSFADDAFDRAALFRHRTAR
jgi:predicted dehydrogenase